MAQSIAYAKIAGKFKSIAAAYDRVIVTPDMVESKTIVIPAPARDRQMATTGVVVAVGESTSGLPFPFAIGQRVVFSRYSGIGINLVEGEEERIFLVLAHSDVVCRINEEEASHAMRGEEEASGTEEVGHGVQEQAKE